ncbi:Guanine nucleotide exchange factor LTE1 [Lasiodiplodia theobromae]|uniref:Guanine nucleotide exchange factor LTE1 n=1 Tax=Lasiodiplodia theobromae TaxID=45133 RepID=A0A5N5D9V4_9PEZI|nr:Guanine nucleotide exchange factor LTE1 [Lasiodiplodia theobromae]
MATSAPAQDGGPRWPGQPAAAHIPAAQRPHSAKQRPADLRRNRQNSLRRAKNSTEQLRARTRGGSSSTVRTDDGAQSRSGGNRFAVGNVGSNGIIYLRPVARTGTPRTRPPPAPFVFPPITPPDSLAPDGRVPRRPSNGWHDSAPSGSRTPTPARTPARSPTPAVKVNGVTQSTSEARPSHHARSHSFSTINDHARSQSIDSNTFKVVIDRPKTSRPRTADTSSFPVLDVPIPHYRLGNPRFSTQGTAILRSSVYTRTSATDDFRSSLFSNKLTPTLGTLFPAPGPMLNRNSQRYSDISSRTRFYDRPITYIEPSTQGSSAPLTPLVPTVPISPKIYDSFTTNADNPSVVRYAATGEITAATPARLIAHITSPSFLDYELLSDFFLTFRSYLTIGDLIAYLIARLRWAVERSDDFGRIVRVRTFVALRHWILNYFTEDFLPFLNLREHFCKLVNDLYHDLQVREDGGGGDLKIIGELKKCWRRTCALFWDDVEAVGRDTPDEDILPGGQAEFEPLVQPARLSDTAPAVAAPAPAPEPVEAHPPETLEQFPGSIIRGALFQPDSPYINLRPTGEVRPMKSHFDLVLNISGSPASSKANVANPGMKKILGSVRRALSSRQGGGSHAQSASDVSNQTTKRDSMGTATVPTSSHAGVQKRRQIRARQQTRVDLLSRRVAESFKKALDEELDKERRNRASGVSPLHQSPERASGADLHPVSDGSRQARPGVERGLSKVTMGSGSILIFDDTGAPPPVPLVMSGALPADEDTASALSVAAAPDTSYLDDALRQSDGDEKLGKDSLGAASRRGEPVVSLPPVTIHPDVTIPSTTSAPNAVNFSYDEVDSYDMEPVPGLPTDRPSLLRHSRSMYPSRTLSGSHSLRRFASFQSGMTKKHRPGYSIDSDAMTRSSDNDPFHLDRPAAPAPARMLRRRPGGDLRGAANMTDLGPIERPRSTGSVSNFAHSVTNSVAYPPLTAGWNDMWNYAPDAVEGAVEEFDQLQLPAARKSLSLIGTHSSQPVLRPSFEREVARLAALPDDDDDDGGIEAALLKLEGKYEKKSPDPSPQAAEFYIPRGAPGQSMKREDSHGGPDPTATDPEPNAKSSGTHRQQTMSGAFVVSPSSEQHTSPTYMPDSSVPQSEYSYSSVPLLDRGNSDIAAVTRKRINEPSVDSARPAALSPQAWRAAQLDQQNPSAGSSIEHIEETESMRRIPRGSTFPRSPKSPKSPNSVKTHQSFLLDPEEEFDDISSDISTSVPNDSRRESHGVRSFFDDQPADLEFGDELVPRPLRHPPTPPTNDNVLDRTIPNNMDSTVFHRGLPTPGLTPPLHGLQTAPISQNGFQQAQDFQASHRVNKSESHIEPTKMNGMAGANRPRNRSIPERERHLPFVLAFDSETLAEQFTIVEKDALDEIDWKELIELRWKQSSPQIRDWVEYLRTQEPRGVDVVIARFNIMVKWAVSEVVITEDLEERVRCIVKYIHIADHARRLRNYATMYQLTVALLSADCARLSKTWELVPEAERRTLRELEGLVQPVKNFHNLRLEMETVNLDDGCIPFIGIYTRDLIYNAQKPATVSAGENDDGEPLINFERHQTSASIVKNLLRLLEASTHYELKPNPDIIPKCVWMAALTDEEISARSRMLE